MRNIIFSLIILLLISTAIYIKADTLEIEYVNRVYDLDTIYVTFKDTHPLFGENIGIRINGIDSPELRTKCLPEKRLAYKAKAFLIMLLLNKKITIENPKRGKYFRLVADVYANDKNIYAEIMDSGYAVSYNGGKKTFDWCNYASKLELKGL